MSSSLICCENLTLYLRQKHAILFIQSSTFIKALSSILRLNVKVLLCASPFNECRRRWKWNLLVTICIFWDKQKKIHKNEKDQVFWFSHVTLDNLSSSSSLYLCFSRLKYIIELSQLNLLLEMKSFWSLNQKWNFFLNKKIISGFSWEYAEIWVEWEPAGRKSSRVKYNFWLLSAVL